MTNIILSGCMALFIAVGSPYSETRDTLSSASIVSSAKMNTAVETASVPVTSIYSRELKERGVDSPKMLSSVLPNFHLPDYGSAMTSSIYIRGFGSRMEKPVMGMYVDDIPILNKNAYDFFLMDIRKVDFLSGPQGTLYGSNSLMGVMSVSTVSPFDWQGCKADINFGSGNSYSAKISGYRGKFGVSAAYRHIGGFYTNEYTGKTIDFSDEASLRFRYTAKPKENLSLDNVLSVAWTDQGGYPYRRYLGSQDTENLPSGMEYKMERAYDGYILPVYYNDPCTYRRITATDGFRLSLSVDKFSLMSVSALHFLSDDMTIDNDFTHIPIFGLQQKQNEYAFTQEFIFRTKSKAAWWNSQSGFFAMAKYNDMSAPVSIKRHAIDNMILSGVNSMIPKPMQLGIADDTIEIADGFGIMSYNLALYHESYFSLGSHWQITAGLRLDHQGDRMDYDSHTTLHYNFIPVMPVPKELTVSHKGDLHLHSWELLPKLSASYSINGLRVYGVISRGFRAGGFNNQLFSDILQGKLMAAIVDDMGMTGKVPVSEPDLTASQTKYKPETSMNYEVGAVWEKKFGNASVYAGASAFYIGCNNQQITVMPKGQNTGRMMANTGRSESMGVEARLSAGLGGWNLDVSYGYVKSLFTDYKDGTTDKNGEETDYAGKRIPYSPESTLSARMSYRFTFKGDIVRGILIGVNCSGTGRTWWNEGNTLCQKAYYLLGADCTLSFKWFDIYVRGENLTGKSYDTFYFKSVGNEFFQRGKPARGVAGISLNF